MIQDKDIKNIMNGLRAEVKNYDPIETGKFKTTLLLDIRPLTGSPLPSERVVLRVSPPPGIGLLFYEKDMMLQEPDVYQQVKARTTIPVPEIYHFQKAEEHFPLHYMVMEYCPGSPLSSKVFPPDAEANILRQTGIYLKELHTKITGSSYGYCGRHQPMQPASDWQKAFGVMWFKLIDDIFNCGVFSHSEASLAKKAYEANIDEFSYHAPASLLHMDIWGQNILVNRAHTITAILDWDRALWGDPELEFAILDYVGFNQPAFWEGYGEKARPDTKTPKWLFYHLYEVMKYLVIFTCRRNEYETSIKKYKNYAWQKIKLLQS